MDEAAVVNIEIDRGLLSYSLEKLHKSILPCDEQRFAKVLRLWVRVFKYLLCNDFRIVFKEFMEQWINNVCY